MVTLTIDGIEVKAQEGLTILEAARNVPNVGEIPTLCHCGFSGFEDLKPVKSCRVCTVEMVRGERSSLILACITPIKEGMVIRTNSEAVKERRKQELGKHLRRCSKVPAILDLAKKLDVPLPEDQLEEEECILCGMCERVCNDPRGLEAKAISLVKQNGLSYYQVDEEECLGCGDCMMVCTLGVIELGDKAVLPKPKALAK